MGKVLTFFIALTLSTSAVSLAQAKQTVVPKESDTPSMARADIVQLKEQIQKQHAVIAALIKRVEELEKTHKEVAAKAVTKEDMTSESAAQEETIASLAKEVRERANLTGYYSFEYINENKPNSPSSFRQHSLSIFLSKTLGKWTFFSEAEFEYAPKFDGNGGADLDTARGEIFLENAWAQYNHNNYFKIRAGQQLLPQYWNVYHYPSLTLSTLRPLTTNGTLFPTNVIGVMFFGSAYQSFQEKELGVDYKFYVGNNQSPNQGKMDISDNKAIGGKLGFHLPSFGAVKKLDIGFDVYRGRFANELRRNVHDTIYGLDTQMEIGNILLQAEYARANSFVKRFGYYIQPAYRFAPNWHAFYRFERLADILPIRDGEKPGRRHIAGLNFRPFPAVSLKVEYFRTKPRFVQLPPTHVNNQIYSGVAASTIFFF